MKKLITGLCLLGIAGTCYGKAVDETTAQNVAYNFYKPKAALQGLNDLSLAYTATSIVNGATVNDFYIFNTSSVTGFVIVSADDNIMPVLGYSTESNFDASKMNPSIKYWLNNYQNEIAYIIQNNINTTSYITAKWNDLESSSPIPVAGKITTGPVSPMLPSMWDQYDEYGSALLYNADCPDDHSTNHNDTGRTLTGCVATAMSQVMKFWNWPDTAMGSVSYTQQPNPDNIPEQIANFAVAYHFDSMQIPKVTTPNSYVAKLMYNAGVSVYMDYGTANEDGSGAYVTEGYSGYGVDTTQCAEYAMRHYWRYPLSHGIQRHGSQFGSQNPNAWVDTMLNEMNAGRPVIYAGSDTSGQGGHCWVMDGYDNDSFFHFNWGWSGSFDCYVTVNDLNPNANGYSSGYVFNEEQEAIIHIIPDTPAHTSPASVSQVASSVSNVKIYPNPATNTLNISLEGITANEIVISDIEGRTMQQFVPAKGESLVTVSVNNLPNGVYLIRLQTDQGALTRKFVVAK